MRRALLMLLVAVPGLAGAAMSWRATPEIVVQQPRGDGHRHEGPRPFYLREAEGAEATLRTPDLQVRPLEVKQGVRVGIAPTGMDGYHLLLAKKELPGEVRAALRYLYLPGKPVGRSPSEQLGEPVTKLEILPSPLPREHWRYESGERAIFQVRFDRSPLANTAVRMITSNGSLVEEMTDAEGMVQFRLPEDFSGIGPGRFLNRPADFVVEAEHRTNDSRFVTTLNADYHVNPKHWQSTLAGGALLAAGFFVGLIAVRPGKERA